MIRFLVIATLCGADGWWWNQNHTAKIQPPWKEWVSSHAPWATESVDRLERNAYWMWDSLPEVRIEGWDFTPASGVWWFFDSAIGLVGWLIFGAAWGDVKLGVRRLLQIGAILLMCVLAHYVWAVCYPVVTVIFGVFMAILWICKWLLRTVGTVVFYVQKWTGGAPDAADVQYHGPGTGVVPETAVLRQFKATANQPKWVAARRGRDVVVFKVGLESQTIRSHGLHLPYEADSVRGSPSLVAALRAGEHVHLCRNAVCTEEGTNHFQEYGLVPRFNAERFQYAQAEQGAKQAGEALWSWMRGSGRNVQRLAQKAREYASESEAEEEKLPCDGFAICWESSDGPERLCRSACTGVAQPFSMLLAEDFPVGKTSIGLCSEHAAQYLRTRYPNKCSHQDCNKVGFLGPQGLKLCTMHQSAVALKDASSRTSRSRPRSRSRSKSSTVAAPEEPGEDPEEAEMEVDDENGGPEDTARNLLREAKQEEPVRKPRRSMSHSPGHTPKSSIHRSLAKIGLLDSPGSEGAPTLLQDFFEKFSEAKLMGWTEDTVRGHLQDNYELEPITLLSRLITEAEMEQSKGQRGLSRFIQKWREARRIEERKKAEDERRGRDSDWSMVDGKSTPMESSPETPIPSFPPPPPGLVSQGRIESKEGTGLRIGAPQVYRADRKAGAGEEARPAEEPMAQIAKAIQHQTAELATLVRNQQEISVHPAGTVKGLGKGSEELIFLLRACGQYQVRLGEGEHGQALANALIAAQVGASSKLRSAGFRQKMTPRLAVGLAGGYWGVHERHCLGAAEFVAYTDAELDAFSSESRSSKPQEQRPQNPQKLDEWIVRVKRQTDVWCLVYGEEWRGVKTHAMERLAEWHMGLPHKWPLSVVMDIWEELHWRFMEEMKELVRLLKKEAARESMTLTEMRFHALLPGPDGQAWLRLPETFNIEKPGTWFQEEVIPRIERKQERLLWNLTWQGGPRKGAPQPAGGDAGGTTASSQADSKPTLKSLWGPKLTAEEVSRAKERAPLDRNGTLLCWGNLCKIGCEAASCQRSHEPLRGPFEALDECVRMQLLKRGGLKRMKAETKESVTAKIKELRAHISKEKGDKIAEGRKGKGPKAGHEEDEKGPERDTQEAGKAGGAATERKVRIWDVPEEFHVDYTKAEDLQAVVEGPKETWANDAYKPEKVHGGRDGESATREAKDLVRIAQGLANQPTLKALQDASDDLYAWAAARVARDPQLDLETLMFEMSTYGLGELAKEAAEILEGCEGARAGEVSRVVVRDTIWASGQPGQGSVQIDGKVWRSWDYGEDVTCCCCSGALVPFCMPNVLSCFGH